MNKITVAIDGYSSTGKSTLAKQLAKALGYVYVDTGAMYRAVTLYAIQNNIAKDTKDNRLTLIKSLPDIFLKFKYNKELGYSEIYLNKENVEKEIRTLEVSKHVSNISTIPEVRHKLVAMQQEMGKNKGVVMDGRDIGTVVFPDAELKVFMTASPEVRAQRRYKELIDRGDDVKFDEVLRNVKERDYIDSHREVSPLRKAEDAIEFDNGDMGLNEQFERIYSFTQRIIAKNKKKER